MYSTVSACFFTVLKAWSKNRPCQSSPDSPLRRLISLMELTLRALMTWEMVKGYGG